MVLVDTTAPSGIVQREFALRSRTQAPRFEGGQERCLLGSKWGYVWKSLKKRRTPLREIQTYPPNSASLGSQAAHDSVHLPLTVIRGVR